MTPFVRDNLEPVLKNKRILLGITGSIAAFKACDIIRFLRACGAQVRVVLSQSAENFVTKTTIETLSGNPVLSSFWENGKSSEVHGTHHIDTARWADAILVAPATANMIGKLAHGLADDLLTTEILAFQGPVLIAPAMNPVMFAHPAVQDNLQTLRSRGVQLLGPTVGPTACGEEGLGRMIEPEEIVELTASAFYSNKNGKKLVVTLGPTRSALDPVRYITNRSSGIMGAAICWAGVHAGYEITAICGPTDVKLPLTCRRISVITASEMFKASIQEWEKAQVFIAAAAVLDWEIANPSPSKLKKELGMPELKLEKTPDILAEVCRVKKPGQYVLGFAAETDNPVENGMDKLKRKNCDALFVNDVSKSDAGFETTTNSGWWLEQPDFVKSIPNCKKTELATQLIQMIRGQYDLTSSRDPNSA